MKQKKKKLKKTMLFRAFFILFMFVSIVFLWNIFHLGILPFHYFLILFFIFLGFNFMIYYLTKSKKWNKRMIGCLLSFVLSIFVGICIYYETATINFFTSAFQPRKRIENYQVIVLKSSNYGSLKEIKTGKIGVPFIDYSEGAKLMQTELKKKTSLTFQESDNSTLVESLLQKNFRAIVMEEAQKNIFVEMDEEFANQITVLETIPITVQNKRRNRDSEITKNAFSVYLSGNDEYGMINQVSRSDVNIIATVNPITHQILLTSIPRDYYITLTTKNGAKDKLTHASLYGIDTSIQALESLLQMKIDYYVKVNFSSLVNLVNAVDGVDVISDQAFKAHYYDEPLKTFVTYNFVEGLNHLNGKEALAFSRERKSFLSGDRERVLHQQLVLSALIDKIASPSILKNYTKILNAVNGGFDTNFTYDEILSFLQKQLDKNASWEITTNILEGSDDNARVYSMSGISTYVMKPDEESVTKAQEMIQNVLNKKE